MNYSCAKAAKICLFLRDACVTYGMATAIFLLLVFTLRLDARPFFACGGARNDDLFRLTGLMAPNAFPKGLRSNVVDFYWLS